MSGEMDHPLDMARKTSAPIKRRYGVLDVEAARRFARSYVGALDLGEAVGFGLPEIDDRYHIWRVALLACSGGGPVGEVVIDAYTGLVDETRTSRRETIAVRLLGRQKAPRRGGGADGRTSQSDPPNLIGQGDADAVLPELPPDAVVLIVRSPPYCLARPHPTE